MQLALDRSKRGSERILYIGLSYVNYTTGRCACLCARGNSSRERKACLGPYVLRDGFVDNDPENHGPVTPADSPSTFRALRFSSLVVLGYDLEREKQRGVVFPLLSRVTRGDD